MDYSFLWSAVAFIGGTMNFTNQLTVEQYPVKILSSDITGNRYQYLVEIANKQFDICYNMNSNNIVSGTLVVSDIKHKLDTLISVQKIDDHIKFYYSKHGYVEISIINRTSMVAIYVENDKKQRVESINVELDSYSNEEVGVIDVTSAYVSDICDHDKKLHMELFLTSGAIDKDYTLVKDVCTFTSSKIAMTIFADIHRQIICTDVYPKKIGADGSIDVINSDYRQHYSYSRENEKIFIEEIVTAHTGSEVTKREYTYTEDSNGITILESGKKFVVLTTGRDVEFVRV